MEYANWIIILASLSLYTGTCTDVVLDGTACDVAIVCTTDSTFSLCLLGNNGTEEVYAGNYSCASGKQCVNGTSSPCQEVSTNETTTELCTCTSTESSTTSTTAATTTEAAAVTAPAECTTTGTYPSANCSEYYQCVQFFWWYNLETQSCSSGQAFSATELACVTNSSCNATTGEFVTEASITVTSTTEAQECYCTTQTSTSTSTTESTSTVSTTESTSTESTTDSTTSTSSTTESTTTSPTTVTTTVTTTASPTTSTTEETTTTFSTTTEEVTAPSSCTSEGKYPSANCNEYYECVYVMWWYELVTQTCDSGEAYDEAEEACVADSSCT